MKKYLIFILSFLLFITGCNKKSTTQIFNDTINNKDDINSVLINAKVDMENEQNISTTINLNGKVKLMEDSNIFEATLDKNNVFGNLKSGKLLLYMPSSIFKNYSNEYSCWIVYENTIDNDKISIFEIKKIQTALKEAIRQNDFTYIDSKGKIYHYQLKLSDNLLSRIYNAVDSIKEEVLDKYIVFDVYIDSKANRVTKIYTDNASLLSKFSNVEEFKNIKKLSFSLEFSDYNNVDVSIPNDVIENALTKNAYDAMINMNNN